MIKTPKFEVSVVIPNFNGETLLSQNLPPLINAYKLKSNKITEIIIVDDFSSDQSVNMVKKDFPEIKIIRHTKNRGFSAAVNTGVRGSKSNYIVLLNTDVSPNRNFLEHMEENFLDDKVFAVSLHEKGMGYSKGDFAEGYIQTPKGEELKVTHPCFFVSGGSGIYRRKIWMELGGMDEKLLSPFYWEDIDISYRALKRGYKLLWEPRSLVIHSHESSISKLPKAYVVRILERNRLLVVWKNITSVRLIRKHITGVVKRTLSHPGYIRVIIMALLKLTIVLQKRKIEIRECKVSDEAIFSRYAKK